MNVGIKRTESGGYDCYMEYGKLCCFQFFRTYINEVINLKQHDLVSRIYVQNNCAYILD